MKKPQIKWTDEKIEYLKLNYGKNNLTELANYFRISKGAVKNAAKRFGYKSTVNHLENKLNPLLQDTIYNWYWYGFIIGDGNFSKNYLRINLQLKDKSHLEKLSEILDINILERGKYVSLCVGDIINCKVLQQKLGLHNSNKTLNPAIFNIPNNDLFFSYVIGLIDADGCIEIAKNKKAKQLKIELHSSWFENLKFIKDFLSQYLNIDAKVSINKRGYALFRITGHQNILKLKIKSNTLNILYLERKWVDITSNVSNCNIFELKKDEIISLFKRGYNLHKISKILDIKYSTLNNHKQKIKKQYEI